MEKYYLKLAFMFVFSIYVNAQEFTNPSESVIEYATPPELIADSIVIYVPDMDLPLHISETTERIIEGQVTKVEKGVEPNLIIHKPNTMITPLKKGVPVKLFLKKFPDREAYYPIAIFPATSEVTESTQPPEDAAQASTKPATDLAKSAVGLWQDTNNEEAYYSFHQNGNSVIIIDLLRLESSGNKFSATYMGSVEDYVLNPILPGLPISVTFQSDKEATITPICIVCNTVIVKLKKIF